MKKSTKGVSVFVISLVIILGVGAFLFFDKSPQFVNSSENNSDLQVGFTLYQQNCASCHGKNLEGEPNWRSVKPNGILPAPPHDETGHTWHHDDLTLFNYTKIGGQGIVETLDIQDFKSGMPAFQDILSDDEIRLILDYIKSKWSEKIRNIQATRNRN